MKENSPKAPTPPSSTAQSCTQAQARTQAPPVLGPTPTMAFLTTQGCALARKTSWHLQASRCQPPAWTPPPPPWQTPSTLPSPHPHIAGRASCHPRHACQHTAQSICAAPRADPGHWAAREDDNSTRKEASWFPLKVHAEPNSPPGPPLAPWTPSLQAARPNWGLTGRLLRDTSQRDFPSDLLATQSNRT